MTTARSFLFIFVFLASFNPLSSFASRGLYFSVSKMTSSQQNTISDYKQGTVVDVQLLNLTKSNAADTSSINGESFDFTAYNTAGSGYLSYDVLKSALNNKYLTGDVTFTVKTSALDKSVTTYTVGAASGSTVAGSLTLNGANIKIDGTNGTSSLTTDPTKSGGTITYTIDGVTTETKTPGSSIVASQVQGNNVCILDEATAVEACAPKAYITAKYGAVKSAPVKELFNDIKNYAGTYTTQTRNGVSTLVYELPSSGTANGITYSTGNNTISTTTNGATVTLGAGSIVEVTNGVVNSFTQPTSKSITITGSTTTTTNYACTDSTGTLNAGECDVESKIPNVDSSTSTTTLAQSGLSSPLIESPTAKTITTSGNTTFTNAIFDKKSTNTFTGIVASGNVKTEVSDIQDSGIDLYSPFLDQTRYLSTPYLSIAQNIRFDLTKIGANWVLNDINNLGNFFNPTSFGSMVINPALAYNFINAVSYIDGNTTYQGAVAVNKIEDAYTIAGTFQDATKNIQSYASVADVSYTTNAFVNNAAKNIGECRDTLCGAGMDYSAWKLNTAIPQLISSIQSLSAAQNALNLAADVVNTSLEASKANNLASYQANYVKGSGLDKVDIYGYKLDDSGNKVKDGTYDVTLQAKDWSFETQRVKDLVIAHVSSKSLAPQFSTQSQMQNFVSALSGQSASGFEMSVGYKFRMFKSAFYAAPQLDISMFRNNSSTISRNENITTKDVFTGLIPVTNNVKVTYGNLDSSYAGSLVAKFGFENKLNLGIFRTPFSIYGFGGGTSGLTTYRSANSQSFGLKYGFGAEIFVSKKLAIFGEMFWIDFLKQNINYSQTSNYNMSDNTLIDPVTDALGITATQFDWGTFIDTAAPRMYINSQLGTTVTLDNAQYGADTKNLSIKYADFNQVIDTSSIKYTTKETFANQASIQGVKFGLTYYVE